jgi:small GTP-binding protein
MSQNVLIPIAVVGGENVGKSAFIRQFVHKSFSDKASSTIGVNIAVTTGGMMRSTHHGMKLKIIDCSGQKRFNGIIWPYLKNVAGVFLLFDLNTDDRRYLWEWYEKIRTIAPQAVVYLIGNKFDILHNDNNMLTGANFAEEQSIRYFEISAKSGYRVGEAFESMCMDISLLLYCSKLDAPDCGIRFLGVEAMGIEEIKNRSKCCCQM